MTSTSSSGGSSYDPLSCGSTRITTPEDSKSVLTSLTQKSTRWRPSFHLMPQTGWVNDPCAPGYNASTGLYYVSFQWNPNGPDWGDIAWGTATSEDMISWKIRDNPILSPDKIYDVKGVFTGCFVKGQDESLNYIYTSVSSLPIHHTIPHQRGCETLSIATSSDRGETWKKSEKNPILPGEPLGLDVTGWRDPFCAPWPNMCKALGIESSETLFGIISGGIRDVTPTSFLYMVDPTNVTDWRYIGPLANFGLNFRPSRWSGDLGKNWEVTNFVSLSGNGDANSAHNFLIMGTEGCLKYSNLEEHRRNAGPSRPSRGQLWMSGDLQKDESTGSPSISYGFGGHLDHGCLYAANSFFDPRTKKQVVWGWITEEDLCENLRYQQGWSGMLSMPRELSLQTICNVVGALASDLATISSVKLDLQGNGTFTLQTLASEPYKPLVRHLRASSSVNFSQLERSHLGSLSVDVGFSRENLQSQYWELECSFAISKNCSQAGLSIGHSEDFGNSTTMTFMPQDETFMVSRPSFPRPDSSLLINSLSEVAPHTLFTTRSFDGVDTTETLNIRAWRDNSVLEVFVNGRTAISTRIYAGEETFGMRFFAKDELSEDERLRSSHNGPTELDFANLWDGIAI